MGLRLLGLALLALAAQGAPKQPKVLRDLEYARAGKVSLRLDLYLPADASKRRPIIVWIHGGGWRKGSKDRCPAIYLQRSGFAVASVDYRLSDVAKFPAQIHDCKAAIRWLRANADRYGLDPGRFAAWGSSAGGHLSALLGTSGGVAALEGTGGHAERSSRVQAVVDFCGPTDLTLLERSGHSVANLLPGDTAEEKEKEAKQASPVTHVSPDDPPFFIVHGSRDPLVPVAQARLLHRALRGAKVRSYLHVVEGAGHGLMTAETRAMVELFLLNVFEDRA